MAPCKTVLSQKPCTSEVFFTLLLVLKIEGIQKIYQRLVLMSFVQICICMLKGRTYRYDFFTWSHRYMLLQQNQSEMITFSSLIFKPTVHSNNKHYSYTQRQQLLHQYLQF
jgi:hypothetical protein